MDTHSRISTLQMLGQFQYIIAVIALCCHLIRQTRKSPQETHGLGTLLNLFVVPVLAWIVHEIGSAVNVAPRTLTISLAIHAAFYILMLGSRVLRGGRRFALVRCFYQALFGPAESAT